MKKLKNLLVTACCITCSIAFAACGNKNNDTDKTSNKTNIEKEDSVTVLNTITGVEMIEEAENINKYTLLGNTYTLIGDKNNKSTKVNRFTDGKSVYEVATNNVWSTREYKDILIKEYEDGMLYVFNYAGNLLYSDKVFKSSKDGNRAYKDERYLNVDNNLVYLADTDTGVVLKCIDLENIDIKYEYAFDAEPIIMNKNLYLMSYYIGEKAYVLNICTGQKVLEFDMNACKLYLAGDKFITTQTEEKYLSKLTQYDNNGNIILEKNFEKEEYLKIQNYFILNNNGSIIPTSDCFILNNNSIVDSSFTTLVSKEEVGDTRLEKLVSYSKNYADISIVVDKNGYKGYVVSNNEVISCDRINSSGAEIYGQKIDVITSDGKHLVINLENGKYFEVSGDLLSTTVEAYGVNDNYKIFAVKTNDGQLMFYDELGQLIIEPNVESTNYCFSDNGNDLCYLSNDNKTLYYYSIKDKKTLEYNLTEEIKSNAGMILGKYFVYSTIDGNNTIFKALNVEDGKIIELYSSDKIEGMSVTDYGFVVKDNGLVKVYRFK